jgi:hypothetical protein
VPLKPLWAEQPKATKRSDFFGLLARKELYTLKKNFSKRRLKYASLKSNQS